LVVNIIEFSFKVLKIMPLLFIVVNHLFCEVAKEEQVIEEIELEK